MKDEHDFNHYEWVKCIKCGLIADCDDYYDKKKTHNYAKCKQKVTK